MFQYPYGDTQQLNLDWLMEQWQETKASIDGSLQGEIDRVEAAITDLLTARDQAVAAKTAAETAATSASGYAGTASTAASTATAQATAAAGSAALAGTHASNAQTSETNAGLQATAAGNSAAAAAVSAGNASNSEGAAATSSSAAAGNALYAEGMAKGTQNGTPVASDSPYYENNAAYWAGEAQSHASNAIAASYYSEAMAKGTINGTPVASGDPGYEDNAEYYKDQAAAQAAAAAASAASADGSNAQKMIAAPEEATSTAAAAHAAGTYFRYNSKLYKATQDIPLGGTITPNTNCVEDTVCAELTAQSEQIGELKNALDGNISPNMTTFVEGGGLDEDGNVVIEENPTLGAYLSSAGLPYSNQYTSSYLCTDFVPVESSTLYQLYIKQGYDPSLNIYNLCQYNENKEFIDGTQSENYPSSVQTTENTKYLRFSLRNANSYYGTGILVCIKGDTRPTEYIAPTNKPLHLKDSDYATKGYVDALVHPNIVSLELPDEYVLVVGDRFELFWKGVINATRYEEYFVEVVCDIGKSYRKKYTYLPILSDVGIHEMTVNLYSNNRDLLDSKTIDLVVVDKATSPLSEKVVLYVTDSLGNSGYVPDEFNRRLVGTGGTPTADSLENITFIGDHESVNRQIKYVGNGGWGWAQYNASMKTNAYMWVTANSHGKTDADQHSIYKDTNNTEWKLETIETNRIKIIRSSGSSKLPATGTLTWVSGGEDHTSITYIASEQAAGNPFWSETQNKISFEEFVESQGESSLDYVYILLGWNGTVESMTTTKAYIRTFLNSLIADYPLCKIVLLGLEIPSENGLAYNYGQNFGVLSSYQKSMQYVFSLNKAYHDISEETDYSDNVSFVNIAGQFDTENNMQTTSWNVNVRNATQETVQNNGIHPAESGYYQIADACYRSFVRQLQA